MTAKGTKTSPDLIIDLSRAAQSGNQLETSGEEHESAQHDLAVSEVRYRRLFETAQDGILIIDAGTGQITDVNPFLSEMLGYSREHFLGKQLWEIGFFKDIDASRQAFRELQSNGFIRYEDLPLETKDSRSMDVEFVSNVYLVDADEVIQCNIRDITARKNAEKALIKAKDNLEAEIKKRTARLFQANKQLRYYALEITRAQEAERKNVARELHDQIGQSLTSLKIMITHAAINASPESKAILAEAETEAAELIAQVREMSRNLRPVVLDDLGLLAALLWHIERYIAQTRVIVAFEHQGLNRIFNPDVSIAVYRVVQESLTNIARHAKVNKADIHIRVEKKVLHVVIHDPGAGFDASHIPVGVSTGLSGMRERVLLLGGIFAIVSSPGKGTTVNVEIPLARMTGPMLH